MYPRSRGNVVRNIVSLTNLFAHKMERSLNQLSTQKNFFSNSPPCRSFLIAFGSSLTEKQQKKKKNQPQLEPTQMSGRESALASFLIIASLIKRWDEKGEERERERESVGGDFNYADEQYSF